MHSAVIVVTPPENYNQPIWKEFCASIVRVEDSPGTKALSEHIWLTNVERSPAVFARLVESCERHKLSYQILAIEREPQWLPVGFDLETNRAV